MVFHKFHAKLIIPILHPCISRWMEKELLEGNLSCLIGYKKFKREVKCGESRFDFQLDFSDVKAFVEVKSVSLVEGSVGKFPDAPTKRGVKHLKELIELRQQGFRTAVIFVSQRSDARSIISNDEIDPLFGEWLRKANLASVELYAYNCSVTKSTVSIKHQIPVNI